MKRVVLWGVLLFSLVACSVINTYDANLGRELRRQQRVQFQKWRLQGRLLIKSDDVLTANIQWQHDGDIDILRLSGALGVGAMLIELSENEIVLNNGRGERLVSQDIDAFIAQQIGFAVPITALRQWVLGEYLPGVSVAQLENGFRQLGWHVTYNEYMDTSVGVMPHKIKVTKEEIKLQLIIDQWEIQ